MNCTGNCALLGLPCECAPRLGRPPFRPCGTMAAYRRHLRNGEKPCEACRAARRRHWQDVEKHRRGRPAVELTPCGTMAAYMRHLRNGETPCGACRAANRDHQSVMYRNRKALAS